MPLAACVEFGYQIVSETYPAGGSLNEDMNFTVDAPEGMLVVGGGYEYRPTSINYSRPANGGTAWEVGVTGPTIQPVTVWAVCVSASE